MKTTHKLPTKWRNECICPYCRSEFATDTAGAVKCPDCDKDLFVKVNTVTTTQYLVLS